MTAFWNNTKTVLLLGGLTGLLVAIGGMLGKQYVIPFFAIGVLMNFGAWFFSDKIAIASMQAREVDAKSGGDYFRIVEELSRRAMIPMPKVYVCPHEAPNAFATGRSPSKAAVAVTQGALRLLSREELEGVVAHELAHIKNRDTLTSTIAATVAGALATLAQMSLFFGAGNNREGGNALTGILTVILAAVGAALLKAAISRSREYVADADGAAIAGSPRGLISALQKLETYAGRVPLHQPNPAMNNMFIVEPMMGESVLRLFATHPPTERRVAALMRG
ncbi:MAG: M48 family metalloprotease [Phycisphaerales bacterium]